MYILFMIESCFLCDGGDLRLRLEGLLMRIVGPTCSLGVKCVGVVTTWVGLEELVVCNGGMAAFVSLSKYNL